MQKNLVIVESPNKIKSLEKYLGSDYEVKASVGHIVHLPSSGEHGFGVDINTWTPNYKVDPNKAKVVKELKAAVKDKKIIYLATDPDREGEAIADNLVTFLKLKNYKRILFNEITEEAVLNAVKNPTIIDKDLVQSQIARRILDRIIGFKLSGLMNLKISNSPIYPSAGRVQSIALKLVVARENEIRAFNPIEYVTVKAQIGIDLFADLVSGNYQNNLTWIDPKKITDVKKDLQGELTVADIKITKRKDRKLIPLKQSQLYKRADSKYGLSSAAVQAAAQRLYEGYDDGGLISYPRTDSTRYSNTFVKKAQAYLKNRFGKNYLTNNIKGAAGAQDAHEAIRPTDPSLTPQMAKTKFNLSGAEAKIYELVYNHALATLMAVPEREILRYDLTENNQSFRLSSSKVMFEGYLKLIGYEKSLELPKYQIGEKIKVIDYLIEDKETTPPPRYNDGSLIETLDKIKVGRPSTFATTVAILKKRTYVEMLNKTLKPTPFGELVLAKLLEAFPNIINEPYTANMEKQLDEIAEAKYEHFTLLDNFWKQFSTELATATQDLEVTRLANVEVGRNCPQCNKPLVFRINKRNRTKFIACSGFPECRYVESIPGQRGQNFYKRKNNWTKNK